MAVGNRYSGKSPMDLTGKRGAQLQAEQRAKQEREQAEAVAKEQRKDVEPGNGMIHPETGRHGGADDPEATVKIRVSYPLEQMTFGREIVDPGQFDEDGLCTRPPVLGSLKVYSFNEGEEYMATPDMASHLRSLGYLYSF